jgi:hypothetical protein
MTIICNSGLRGWRCRLRENYANEAEFAAYAETYCLHTRLGFKTIQGAWLANPIVEGSVEPSDFRKVAR